ncbi:hypothetical protein BDV95DRAFT_606135 [Massariosphaeria phaeospora]|uniref:EthD domain-containing protein n=1 Tax=Massariosphaeria phaeospora TaxID=100035 RepID=A0A7C8IC38_9PLEO|nr:hypothetical protein BDV95DRAFT_606135 [Massariosphaeria phaeospora]
MSDANTTPPSWSGPGIIQNFIGLPESPKISQETLETWFDEVYVPALVKTGVVQSAWRFRAASPENGKQHMTIYKIPDLAQVAAGKLTHIPRTSNMFPSRAPVDDFVDLDSRVFSLVQLYETTKQPEDAATTIINEAIESRPDGASELDAWYREEHNQYMSEQPGWQRTTRFSLVFQERNDGKEPEGTSSLSIHEFGDGHGIGQDALPFEATTDRSKRVASEARVIDAAIYYKVKAFGKASENS